MAPAVPESVSAPILAAEEWTECGHPFRVAPPFCCTSVLALRKRPWAGVESGAQKRFTSTRAGSAALCDFSIIRLFTNVSPGFAGRQARGHDGQSFYLQPEVSA